MESKGKSRTGTREGRMRGARRGPLGSAAGCGLSGFFTLFRLFRQVFPAGLARSRCWLDGRGSHAVEGKGGGLILGQDGRTDGRTGGRLDWKGNMWSPALAWEFRKGYAGTEGDFLSNFRGERVFTTPMESSRCSSREAVNQGRTDIAFPDLGITRKGRTSVQWTFPRLENCDGMTFPLQPNPVSLSAVL
jgi:hypothetical protein